MLFNRLTNGDEFFVKKRAVSCIGYNKEYRLWLQAGPALLYK
ncbi:hypothetical protein SAMN04487894_10491 [Niabella drilacis]|uniref:Uncharacterized protein n=1 Tax=Niabella drilacis (strain DSM 25811 / CCM 8410 / CCUG 62505 / LMG 26954 / E90) TaxID=1285928 RepID=A0A1G6PM64_NIADE|nr:hypothetical protein SAMN04487894_10491 [Niabella drilacis]